MEIMWRSLFIACKKGYFDIACLLVTEGGADVNTNNFGPNGWTPLFFAIVGRRIETACLLISLGADHEILDNHGSSAIDYLRRVGSDSVYHVGFDEHDAKAQVEQAVRDYKTLRACVPILK